MSDDRLDIVFESRKLQHYCLWEGCGHNEEKFYKHQQNSRRFSRNTIDYQCIDSRCKAVIHITRRSDRLGDRTFLFGKHTCDYSTHENFEDETLLESCYDRYPLGSEPPTVLDAAGDGPYPPDIIDFSVCY